MIDLIKKKQGLIKVKVKSIIKKQNLTKLGQALTKEKMNLRLKKIMVGKN